MATKRLKVIGIVGHTRYRSSSLAYDGYVTLTLRTEDNSLWNVIVMAEPEKFKNFLFHRIDPENCVIADGKHTYAYVTPTTERQAMQDLLSD